MAHLRIADVGGGDLVAGVEAVDLLHQIEDDAEHVEVLAGGDDARVRHLAAGQGVQHGDLALHGAVAIGPRVRRRAAQH